RKTPKPHSSPRVARGFLLWRISYTCRCPISFTEADIDGEAQQARLSRMTMRLVAMTDLDVVTGMSAG
ncbi:hypothetical protein, partial [Sphingomonas sp. 2378]|uniref:hypothetical protein n=1 Tax=Sphingomonas sp. 2378 TaxID=1219748 RepID=UPI00311AD4CA